MLGGPTRTRCDPPLEIRELRGLTPAARCLIYRVGFAAAVPYNHGQGGTMRAMRWAALGAVVLTLIMLGSGLASVTGASGAAPPSNASTPPVTTSSAAPLLTPSSSATVEHFGANAALASTVASDERSLSTDGRAPSALHPPNLHAAPPLSATGGHVTPLYSIAPAPMGAGYFGLSNTTGTTDATTVNTTSLAGTYSTSDPLGTQTQEYDVSTGSSYYDIQPSYNSYGAQLNAVLTNVSIFGKTSFYNPNDPDAPNGCPGYGGNPTTGPAPCPNEFWMQNYIEYQPATGEMQIGDEVWNFSNPSASWGGQVGNTTVDENSAVGFGSIAYGLYFLTNTPSEYGPTIYIGYPFTLVLYINITRGPCHLDTVPGTGVPSCSVDGSTVSMTAPVNEIFMNYSVWKPAGDPCPVQDVCQGNHVCPAVEPYSGIVCGEYDDIFFNSVNPKTPHHGVPEYGPHGQIGSAGIEANGSAYDPVGLTNDFEFDYGIGSDDGDTNGVAYQDGTVGIEYCPQAQTLPNGACDGYRTTPAASNFGGETGETSMGETDYWAPQATPTGAGFLTPAGSPLAHIVTGPSILTGLWNMTGAAYPSGSGEEPLSYVHISPANAWVGIAHGAYVTNQAQFQVAPTFGWYSYWAGSGGSPTRTELGANLYLTPGWYTIEVLLGGYVPAIQTINLTAAGDAPTITLLAAPSEGVYTPLWAFSASDLANISTNAGSPGIGTVANQYHIESQSPTLGAPFGVAGSLSWLFSDLNDYLFPAWLGEFINGTNVYAQSDPAPSYFMQYPSWQTGPLEYFGVPTWDQFQLYFLHVSNFTLENTPSITSWSSAEAIPVYSVVCNDCQNTLVADNTFLVSNRGIEFIHGGTAPPGGVPAGTARNTVWGNTFLPAPMANYSGVRPPSVALVIRESYDRIYNNAFDAYDATLNATASSPGYVQDWWNATCQTGYRPLGSDRYPGTTVCEPLGYTQVVNGRSLSGSIIGSAFQGGNYWASYGDRANPYATLPYKAHRSDPSGPAYIGSTLPTFAGDYAPLIDSTVYRHAFTERGLPASSDPATFSVQIWTRSGSSILWTNSSATVATGGGCAKSLNCVTFYLPDGGYRFTVNSAVVGNTTFSGHPSHGKITVEGTAFGTTLIVFFPHAGPLISDSSGPVAAAVSPPRNRA
jgi:thermopsin